MSWVLSKVVMAVPGKLGYRMKGFFAAGKAMRTGSSVAERVAFCHFGSPACQNARMASIDSLDQQLMALLRTDARASVATLAHKLGVSRGTVSNRITRLEDAGVITGYTVRLRPDAQPDGISAWMSIAVEGNQTRAVIGTLLGEPGVAALHDTNGRWDLLAELRAANLGELAEVLERVRLIKGIGATETSIHLQTYKLS
jgi:DNA-binding Lrp family transcriptional regulator